MSNPTWSVTGTETDPNGNVYAISAHGTFNANGTAVTDSSHVTKTLTRRVGIRPLLGSPSPSGYQNLTYQVTYGPQYQFDNQVIWCWGGGTPGVHWGYVYNCSYSPGNGTYPGTAQYCQNVGLTINCSPDMPNLYYYGWSNMNYSPDTGFADHAAATVTYDTVPFYSRHPYINLDVYANGTWDVSLHN